MSSSLIWCLGVYGSASTWMFNAVRLLHTAAHVPVEASFAFDNFKYEKIAKSGNHIVKTHEVKEAVATYLENHARVIIITIRDPRDEVTSLMRSHAMNFAMAVDGVEEVFQLCARMAAHPNAHLMCYEERFFENTATIPALAKLLGYDVPKGAMDGIFASLTRAAVEKYIKTLPGKPGVLMNPAMHDYLDPETHWHTHHANRKGEIGGFRKWLREKQIQEIEQRFSGVYAFERLTLSSNEAVTAGRTD